MAKTTKQFHFFLVIIPFFFLSLNSFAQQRIKNVTGKVTANTGEVIQGVSVNVEGTEKGTITDTSGVYKIKDVTDAATLVFSHVGFTTRRVVVSNRIRIDIALREDNTALNEVVVTALGIKQQAKSLVYSTQSVKASQLTEVRDPNNFLNSLQGKVVNAQITQSSGGVGSKAQIILRGNRSISGSNTALIVVDGVPDLSNTMPNINPDDIMSITILPSASAGVLYGSQAGNGAIIITTKKGTKGKTSVNVNSGLVFESPFALPKFQNVYGQGNNGVIDPVLGDSWGAKMGGQSYTNYLGEQSTYSPQPNNINDFFNNGISLNNSISVSSGTEKMQTYLSYVNKDVHGIVPNNDLMSHTVSLRITNQISKRFSTDAKLNYLQQDIKHKLRGEEGFFPVGNEENNGPVFDLYQMPRNVSVVDAMKYQTINSLGISVPTPWPSVIASTYQNPYWVINNDVINERMDVISGFLNTKFEITNWLSVTGRANLQKSFIGDEQSVKVGTIEFATKPGGYYSQSNTISFQKWFDVIFEGTNKITTNLNINYHAGAIYQDNSYSKNDAIADGLNVANKFSLNFATNPTLMSVGNRIQTQSVFGQFNLSYKRLIYFDGSLRNDWDSRLPS
ncbi:MAG TPA: carboxypeptidase-like regulatory domain-containing protein, partial [Hanamia sp.]